MLKCRISQLFLYLKYNQKFPNTIFACKWSHNYSSTFQILPVMSNIFVLYSLGRQDQVLKWYAGFKDLYSDRGIHCAEYWALKVWLKFWVQNTQPIVNQTLLDYGPKVLLSENKLQLGNSWSQLLNIQNPSIHKPQRIGNWFT